MTTILGISGSLRSGSFNTHLLAAAAQLTDAGTTLDVASIRGVPLYDGDIETTSGLPQAVRDLKARVVATDGLLLVSPEYNNGIPGVFKNAIDWMSRPPAEIGTVFGGRAVAVIGASPGGFGTILAQDAWLPVLRTLGTRPWFGGRLLVSRAHKAFNDRGELIDDAVRSQLRDFVRGFAAFVQANVATGK